MKFLKAAVVIGIAIAALFLTQLFTGSIASCAFVVLWWGLCLAVGVVAEERDRGLLTWFALAFVLSPLAAAIIIALLPKRLAELRHLELLAALARGQ